MVAHTRRGIAIGTMHYPVAAFHHRSELVSIRVEHVSGQSNSVQNGFHIPGIIEVRSFKVLDHRTGNEIIHTRPTECGEILERER